MAFDDAQSTVHSLVGRMMLILASLAVFYHLCNGIRHLVCDSDNAFKLSHIYVGGWAVVGANLVLTSALWVWILT